MARKSKNTYKKSAGSADGEVKLLSGGNPQIAKADGDAPVQKYIAHMPEMEERAGSAVGRSDRADCARRSEGGEVELALVRVEGEGWFVSYHVFTRYVKVTFLNGSDLDPEPPGSGKDPDARWVDIYEGEFDEEQMEEWVRQSSAIPGWKGFDTL